MKILHCINTLKVYGGAEKIVSKLIGTNHNFFLFELYPNGVPNTFFSKLFCFLISAINLIYKRHEFDFFHFHLFPSFYLSIFVPKNKVIIHEHNTYNKRRSIWLFKIIESYIYKRAKSVVCISEATKENLSSWVGSDLNLVVIPNFSRFDYSLTENKLTNCQRIDLLMVASFTDQKRQLDLIHAAKFLPDRFMIHFLGDGPSLSKLKIISKTMGLTDRIIFHGNVDNVEEYYKSCDFCVLLSNWEGFGLVVVEAASFNKVTLASNVSGLNSIINDPSLLIDKDSTPSDLAIKILSLHHELSINGVAYQNYCENISKTYSYDSFLKKINSVYEEAI